MKIEHSIQVTQWGCGKGAKRIPMYLVAVPAVTLADKAVIYRRTPHRPEGYQRKLASVRLGKGKLGVAGYLLNQMGIFPTSILVNIRQCEGLVKFNDNAIVGENIQVGDLVIPDQLRWYVIDGQHRIEGLKIAIRNQGDFEDYPTILTITNETMFYEMLIFYLVNSRAKSVPTDLAYRIFQKMLYDKETPRWVRSIIMAGGERRKGRAVTVVDHLNNMEKSPFRGRVLEVGEIRGARHITKDGTLARYITIILKEKVFDLMDEEELAELLSNYWNVLQELFPNAFRYHDVHLLLSTIGLSSMMRLFPTVHAYCVEVGLLTKGGFRKFLSYLREETPNHRDPDFRQPITDTWWNRLKGPGLIRGTGEGHYKEIATKFAEKIALAIQAKSQD